MDPSIDNPKNHQLAEDLKAAKSVSKNRVIRSADLDRKVRERLTNSSYLTEVIRGWYLLTTPAGAGTTTLWYSSFWAFISSYLEDRFEDGGYCLSAESSLDAHAAQNIIPQQLVVITKRASNQTIELSHGTSILLYQDEKSFPAKAEKRLGVRAFSLAEALCRASATYFQNHTLEIEIAIRLSSSSDAELSRILLENRLVAASNRVVGALEKVGETEKAKQITKNLIASGMKIKPEDPFAPDAEFHLKARARIVSPYSGRIFALWDKMRPVVLKNFADPPGLGEEKKSLNVIRQLYRQDAYHSLSIEGYQVTEDLIQRMRDGQWSPESEKSDSEHRNAMAAKGYQLAFDKVVMSVSKILQGQDPGAIFEKDLQDWYRDLFTPLVQAQLIPPASLAGYRNSQVYISQSRHVPPPVGAVLDSMETLMTLLKEEAHPAVKAILGHFIFMFIHPYMDGNGRIGRFIMNLMLVSGGYQWTVIRASERARYMAALEEASARGNILPFTKFVEFEMRHWSKELARKNS